MSVPPFYKSIGEYFDDCLSFLKAYQWIYINPNTEILVNNVFQDIPCEWVPILKNESDFFVLLQGDIKNEYPTSLKNFLNRINCLKPKEAPLATFDEGMGNSSSFEKKNDEVSNFVKKCKISNRRGLSQKKKHEILLLTDIVHKLCEETNSNLVIDIGSGSGYLSQMIHDCHNYYVLGIEGKSDNIKTAQNMQNEYHKNSKDFVKFRQHFITSSSSQTISTHVKEAFNNPEIKYACIAGLHACADLSVTIFNVFNDLDFTKSIAIMPCCYHLLTPDKQDGTKESFKYFPASQLLKQKFVDVDGESYLKRTFLRLACQETIGRYLTRSKEDHELMVRSCMYRAILQEVVKAEKWKLVKLKGAQAKHITTHEFADYIKKLQHTFTLEHHAGSTSKKLKIDDPIFAQKMNEKWQQHKSNCYLAGVVIGLQAAIQSTCENLILLDRVQFLKEKGFLCSVQKVTDDRISPRCHALVATKP